MATWLRWCAREFHITPPPDAAKFPRCGRTLLELDGPGFESRSGSSRAARLLRSHLAHTLYQATGRATSPLKDDVTELSEGTCYITTTLGEQRSVEKQ